MCRIYITKDTEKGMNAMATFTIRGKNIEVTPALHDYVEKKIGKVTKYFDNVGEITVLLTVSKDRHIVEVLYLFKAFYYADRKQLWICIHL